MEVELLYTEGLVLWDDGEPGHGGYYARIAGFVDQGEGRTVEQAIERLAGALRNHVESWNAEIDEHARARRQLVEPTLVGWARVALSSGRLEELLLSASTPARLEPSSRR